MASAALADTRINLRARVQDKATIERAAALRDMNLSNFIMQNAVKEAKAVLEEEGIMVLDDVDRQAFVNAFLEPYEPTPYMKRAIAAYKKG